MTKQSYIKEFGYVILDNNEAVLSTQLYTMFFMNVCLFQSGIPNYMWN